MFDLKGFQIKPAIGRLMPVAVIFFMGNLFLAAFSPDADLITLAVITIATILVTIIGLIAHLCVHLKDHAD